MTRGMTGPIIRSHAALAVPPTSSRCSRWYQHQVIVSRMSNGSTWPSVEEAMKWADASVMPGYRQRIWDAIRKFLAGWAFHMLAESHRQADTDRDIPGFLRFMDDALRRVQTELGSGSRLWQHRCMSAAPAMSLIKRQKGLMMAIRAIVNQASRECGVQRLSPERRAALSDDHDLLEFVTGAELEAWFDDLQHCRMPNQWIDFVYSGLLSPPGAFLEPHCVLLACDLQERSDCDLFHPSDQAVAACEAFLRGELSDADFRKTLGGIIEARQPLPPSTPINTRIGGLLITSAKSWAGARSQVEEHFGVTLPLTLSDQWNELRGQSEYVLVFQEALPFNDVQPAVEYWLRQLIALTRCHRHNTATRLLADAGFGQFHIDNMTPAQCNMLAVPLGSPRALLEVTAEEREQLLQPIMASFPVAAFPFINATDLAAVAKDVELPWQWLMSVRTDASMKLHRALQCFETANSIGGGRGAISADLEQAWAVVGLTTTLEVAFCPDSQKFDRSSTVMRQLRPMLRRVLNSQEAKRREQTLSRVLNQRNNCVHKGHAHLAAEDIMDARETVAIALRCVIEQSMRDAHQHAP